MQGTITIIKADGTISLDTIDAAPTLDQLQAFLDGGWLEQVPGLTKREGNKCVAFCDEEGKIKGLPVNALATQVWHAAVPYQIRDVLVGPVIIIEGDDELLGAL